MYNIIDAENLLASVDPLSTSGGLVGISEAVELEEEATHDSDAASGIYVKLSLLQTNIHACS